MVCVWKWGPRGRDIAIRHPGRRAEGEVHGDWTAVRELVSSSRSRPDCATNERWTAGITEGRVACVFMLPPWLRYNMHSPQGPQSADWSD